MNNDPTLPHRQIWKQQRMTKLPVTEISSKLHVIKTMTTAMETLLMTTIIKEKLTGPNVKNIYIYYGIRTCLWRI
jgi:hypothetical protein